MKAKLKRKAQHLGPKPRKRHGQREVKLVAKPKSRKPAQPMMIYQNNRPVQLNNRQVELIKSLYAKNSTPDEFELFMQICKSSRLDPFKKEIYFVKFDTKRGPQMVIITGIDGYRGTAARDHKDFGGADAATFTWFDPPQFTPAGKRIPESATVAVKDTKGGVTTATVWWEELAPVNLGDPRADFWNRMPKNQLEKCAEAKGIRKRFPGMGNIFIREEMDHKLMDYTEEGRQISIDGVAPSGAVVDEREMAKATQQRILDEKLPHGHLPGSERAKQAEAILERTERNEQEFLTAQNITPTSDARGASATQSAGTTGEVGTTSLAGTTVIRGVMHRCIGGMTTEKKVPYRDVRIGQAYYKCWHRTMFSYLDQFRNGGFIVEVWVDKRNTIQGLVRVGPLLFEADGKTPRNTSREPGSDE